MPTCQIPGIYYFKTKTTSILLTSDFHMKSKYVTPPYKLRVHDLKVRLVVLGFQKNTNQQALRHYHFILHMRISWTLSNSRYNFGHCLSMNVYKMDGTVCINAKITYANVKYKRTDALSRFGIHVIRRMRTRQCSHLSLVKIRATMSHL